MAPKCRYENFEMTSQLLEAVSKFQKQAKNQPDSLLDTKLTLLVYWPDDKVWYYCTPQGYDKYSDKFELLYDDGVKENVHLWAEQFIVYDRVPFQVNDYSASYWYGNQQDYKSKNGALNESYQEAERKYPKRPESKDTTALKNKPVEKVQIEEFTILAKEYDAYSENSSLSDENMNYQETDKGQHEQKSRLEHMERRKNSVKSKRDLNNYLNLSGEGHGYSSVRSRGNHPDNREHSGVRMQKDKDLRLPANHSFSLEETANSVIKNGPFETIKIPRAKEEEHNQALMIEKKE
jgi:hypothetical protein